MLPRLSARRYSFFQAALALAILTARLSAVEAIPSQPAPTAASISWQSDYHAGLDEAKNLRRLAFLWFCEPAASTGKDALAEAAFSWPSIAGVIEQRFVGIKLPTTVRIQSRGQEILLLDHPAFAEMHRSPGLAVIDMTDENSPLFRQVISVYPFKRAPISPENLAVLLDLPRGTLTQRTLVFAVRAHPEQPASASGHFSQILARETENHAWHQASITLQGHHNWESRFHAINAELPGGMAAREVCAESWPGQSLLEAAEECVHSWRQSPGHWEAVRSRHMLFGYDMKLGANGVWYAAGIFAGR